MLPSSGRMSSAKGRSIKIASFCQDRLLRNGSQGWRPPEVDNDRGIGGVDGKSPSDRALLP